MRFTNLRKKADFSISVSIILLLAVVFAGFGTSKSSAGAGINQLATKNRFGFEHRRGKNGTDGRENGKTAFSATDLIAGQTGQLLEVLLEGDLDTTFGTGGKVTTQFGNSRSEALALALQKDGKFVASGYSSNGANNDFALARYEANGSLDATFGSGGKVMTDIGNAENVSLALTIQPADGKLVAAGSSFNGVDADFALVRYKTDGTLDETFGTGGIVTTNFTNSSEYIDALAIQTDGKIVAAGYRFDGSYFHFALARYNSNGTLDAAFGNGGRVITVLTKFDDLARAIALQSDGKIVVAGEADSDFAVARYNSDGSLDATFDGDGKVSTSINIFDSAYDVALQPDGKIVAAGETGNGTNSDFVVVRYDLNGALDATFGGGGAITTQIGGGDEFASSVVLQNGKIIVGGFSSNGADDDFAVIRYNSNGTLDSSFGAGGKVTTNFGGSSFDYISALAIQSATRLIAVGSANSNFAAAAYSLGTPACSYTLSAAGTTFPATGGTGSFSITTEASCSRTAVSNDSWITINSGGSGTGNGFVNFSVEANTGAARTGTITAGGQTFTVTQVAVKSRKRARITT